MGVLPAARGTAVGIRTKRGTSKNIEIDRPFVLFLDELSKLVKGDMANLLRQAREARMRRWND